MSDAGKREWRFYIDDMIDFAEKVLAYTEGLDQTSFEMSGMTYDATLRNLELIGEAANHIPKKLALPTLRSPGGCSSPLAIGLFTDILASTTTPSGALSRTMARTAADAEIYEN